MKRKKHNVYGYKVCYKKYKNQKETYVIRFKTNTYKQALKIKQYYLRYPPDNLNNLLWYILPITKKEYKKGIWKECPF